MVDIRTTTSADQREASRHQVLHAIRSAGSIARIDIARKTQVSPATVSTITSELLGAGLIEEIEPLSKQTATKRGRPRVALRIRGAAHLIAGIKIASKAATAILVDFDGNTVADHEEPLSSAVMSAQELSERVGQMLASVTRKIDRPMADLSAVGVGLAGLIDANKGFVHWSPSLSERNVALGQTLNKALPFPAFIDNDANLVAMAEQRYGEGRGRSNFIVITIEQGVGMGIVLNGNVYRGERGCGAEFGHTKVQLEGALCRCGQRGCLEAYVGDYALLREANIRPSDTPERDLSALFEQAQAGDAMAKTIFDRAGRMFAMGLANMINIFDPELVILAGERMTHDFLVWPEVLERLRASTVQVDAAFPEIRIHRWGDLMWAKGAAAYAVEHVSNHTIQRLAAHAA